MRANEPNGTPRRVIIDLGDVALGLVEDVDHLFVSEEHLEAEGFEGRSGDGSGGYVTIMALTRVLPTCWKVPAFWAVAGRNRPARVSHRRVGDIRRVGMKGAREKKKNEEKVNVREVSPGIELRSPEFVFASLRCRCPAGAPSTACAIIPVHWILAVYVCEPMHHP